MFPDVEEIKGMCNKLNINPYFVCSEKGMVVYIASTEDEANEFIKSHNSLIELHIASENFSKNKKGLLPERFSINNNTMKAREF